MIRSGPAAQFRPRQVVVNAASAGSSDGDGTRADDSVCDGASSCADFKKWRRSSAMSCEVVYRSDARFESAFKQIRSSSLGIVSSIWRGGRGSDPTICARTLSCASRPGTADGR